MKLITTFDRQIIRRLLGTYAVLVAGLIVFFVVLHYVEYVDDFMDRGATMSDVFTVYYPNYVPEIVRLISPLALFLGTMFLVGRLAQKLELAALQTAGVSLYRILMPFVLVAVLLTGFMFWFNGWVVPGANRVRLTFEHQYTKDRQAVAEFNNIHRQNRPGSLLSVGFFERTTNTGHTVTLVQFDDGERMVSRIDAPRMEWIDSTRTWRFRSATVRSFLPDGREERREYPVLDSVLTLYPQNMARTDGDVESMTITEAREYLDVLERSGANNMGIQRVTYHGKYAYPFANLILVLLGVPLAAVRRRRGQALVLGVGLLVAFGYLSMMKLLEPFGYSGLLAPQVTAWAPHVLFLFAALVVLFQART